MRFDDTNPAKEDMEYVNAILDDVRWLVAGATTTTQATTQASPAPAPWDGAVRHASDYFPVILEAALFLIKQGKAYVDDLSPEEMKTFRGTLTGRATKMIHSFIHLFMHHTIPLHHSLSFISTIYFPLLLYHNYHHNYLCSTLNYP